MSIDITIHTKNSSYIKIECDQSIAKELADYFSFEEEGAKFSPLYKAGVWDGRKKLFSSFTKEMYSGLAPYVIKYAKDHDYTVSDLTVKKSNDHITREVIEQFCKALKLHSHGVPIEINDYQVETVYRCIKEERLLPISPTSSGKSLILYCVSRWLIMQGQKILFLVPNIGLVSQMYSDFEDYSSENKWNVDKYVHQVYAGKEKNPNKQLVLSTWQSLFRIGKTDGKKGKISDNIPKDYFDQFTAVLGDEAHLYKAKSITGIMERCRNAEFRCAVTGTLDGKDVNKLVIEGIFGPVFKVITTKELMDRGTIATLQIKCIQLKYSDEVRKAAKQHDGKKLEYAQEIDFLVSSSKRNNFIANLAVSQKKNCLVLFHYVEKHGKPLYDLIRHLAGDDRTVLFLSGDDDVETRDEAKRILEAGENVILVASRGIFSTGVSVRNIHSVIFASSTKSQINTLQSIGRGLRLDEGKTSCVLYDVSDNLSWKKRENHTLLHSIERIKIYAEQRFNYKIYEVAI